MATTIEFELKRELQAQKDRADVLAAWLSRYVVDYNVEHLKDCPEDDTCGCPHVRYLNAILEGSETVDDKDDPSYLRSQLALAERDRNEWRRTSLAADKHRRSLESAIHEHLDCNLTEDEATTIARTGRAMADQKEQIRRLNEEVERLRGDLTHAERCLQEMNESGKGLLDSLRARLSFKSAP
jgi:hypothetical protein